MRLRSLLLMFKNLVICFYYLNKFKILCTNKEYIDFPKTYRFNIWFIVYFLLESEAPIPPWLAKLAKSANFYDIRRLHLENSQPIIKEKNVLLFVYEDLLLSIKLYSIQYEFEVGDSILILNDWWITWNKCSNSV